MGAKKRKAKDRAAVAPPAPASAPAATGGRAVRFLGRHWAIWIGVLTLLLFVSVVHRYFYFQGGDDADYLMLGRALATGQGYTTTYTDPPQPHTKYPFLFPLLLAGVTRLFGENLVAIKVMIAICAALMAGAACRLGEDRGEKWIGPLAAAVTASIPFTLKHSVRILTEIPFAAWAILALLFFERARKKDSWASPDLVLSLLFALAAYFTRSIGITLWPALVGAALLRTPVGKRFRQNLFLAAALALPLLAAGGAWWVRGYRVAGGLGSQYLNEFFTEESDGLGSPLITLPDLMARAAGNGKYYLDQIGAILIPFANPPGSAANSLLILALLALAGLGWWRLVRLERGAPELFAPIYSLLLLLWDSHENRFLIPLYPLLLYYWLKGLEAAAAQARRLLPALPLPAVSTGVIAAVSAVMLISNLWADGKVIAYFSANRQVPGFEINPWFKVAATSESRYDMLDLAVRLRDWSDPDTVVLTRKPSLVALVSGRKVVGGPFPTEPSALIRELEQKRVRLILVDQVYPELRLALGPALAAYPERFQLLYQSPESQSLLYRFLPAAGP